MSTVSQSMGLDDLGGEYDPELYRASIVAEAAPRPTDVQWPSWEASYREHGYQAVQGLFTHDDVDAAMAGIDHLISGQVEQFRGVQWERAAKQLAESSDLATRRDLVRKLMYYVDHDERLHRMAHAPQVIELMERLLGEPVTLFADQALLKPPGIGREKPWHQDLAYFDLRPGAPVVGLWIALDEADIANGCMHLVSDSHHEGSVVHFNRRDFQICDTELAGSRVTAVPLHPGDALVFDGLLWHGTPRNGSDRRRWALQFHYARTSDMWQTKEQRHDYKEKRLAVFGADGKDVTC
ncbi:MAG TPA: phytanoyl-CoA dioxygenase family protein [Candidatus Avipropionibacterium avicola]|uniref:Phytanoyl-CoA dioxygenase family protein n=1 Tax=Candidatus Avipropionibacterium avicola TaxID=2840701 RepID=A0A9D1KMC3_9ACTN|nr:phytanoyl-CoA dioxygenase family protein [Candidatus Avipropionibacterium avicola]